MNHTSIARTACGAMVLAALLASAACGGSGEAAQRQTLGQAPQAEGGQAAAPADGPLVVVYKTPTCGCCRKWVDHMQANGFRVEVHDVPNTAPKRAEWGVPESLGSCHTAKVEGYALEGHVSADDVKRLLAEKPQVAGIAAPGMPMGSPGMEGPVKDRYDVVAFTKDGQTSVFASH
jgi:hypothetical protein